MAEKEESKPTAQRIDLRPTRPTIAKPKKKMVSCSVTSKQEKKTRWPLKASIGRRYQEGNACVLRDWALNPIHWRSEGSQGERSGTVRGGGGGDMARVKKEGGLDKWTGELRTSPQTGVFPGPRKTIPYRGLA